MVPVHTGGCYLPSLHRIHRNTLLTHTMAFSGVTGLQSAKFLLPLLGFDTARLLIYNTCSGTLASQHGTNLIIACLLQPWGRV